MLSAVGGCELSTTTRVKTAWKKFKELKPVLSSRHLSFKAPSHVYSMCVRSAMLHASKTWPVTKPCLQRLQGNDRAMIRQICNVKPQDTATIRSTEPLVQLGNENLDLILNERRLRWYGHVECSNSAVKAAFDIQVKSTIYTHSVEKETLVFFTERLPTFIVNILLTDLIVEPGHVAKSVEHLTRRSGVLGSIPGLAIYFRFSFHFFKKGSCQLLAKVCARSTG